MREGARGGEGDTLPTERTISDLSKPGYRSIFAFLWRILAVVVGATAAEFKMTLLLLLPLALYKDCPDEGDSAGRIALRPFDAVAGEYHVMRLR